MSGLAPERGRIASFKGTRAALISRVDLSTHAEVKDRARRAGLSMSDWVATAVRAALRT